MKTPIPNDILLSAVNATLTAFPGKCADKWGEFEKAYCRNLCGQEYQHIETDWIGQKAINFRKDGKCVSVNNGPKRKAIEKPSGQYAEYLSSDHWRAFRLTVLEFWKYRCCLCSDKAIEVHHNTYVNLGNESLSDCVALCRQCHKQIHGRLPSGNEVLNESGGLFV